MAPFRPTRGYPNCFVTNTKLPGLLNLATGLLFQRVWWRGLHQDINRFRSDLGLAATKRPTASRMATAGNVELQAFSPTLAPAIHDYGERRPMIGFLRPEPETRALLGEAVIDHELDAWLDAGDPPAFFGFGSMPVTDPAAALRMITQVTDALGLPRWWEQAGVPWRRTRPEETGCAWSARSITISSFPVAVLPYTMGDRAPRWPAPRLVSQHWSARFLPTSPSGAVVSRSWEPVPTSRSPK